jgi:hypothetical protein
MIPSRELSEMAHRLRQKAMDALDVGSYEVAISLHPVALLAFLDACEGVGPKNLPAILRDDGLDRLEAATYRIEQAALALGIMPVNK